VISIKTDHATVDASVNWIPADARTRAAWANELDATRDGAYAVAVAATELAHGFCAVARAEHATGADYYMAPIAAVMEDLENWLRLEISGMDRGSVSDLERRLRSKIEQATKVPSNLPVMAGVVGFQLCQVMTSIVEGS
jgi:hypothetical protein